MRKVRVLFVDDEADLVEDLPPVLEATGWCEAVGATTCEEALRLFDNSDFDVVLTDIAMPPSRDMNGKHVAYGRETGIELARLLHTRKPGIPIVALTVIRDSAVYGRMKDAGICRILTKPQEIDQILGALKDVLQR